MARVNKFLKKASGEKVKKAYIQDDDLMDRGGKINTPYFIHWTNREGLLSILDSNELWEETSLTNSLTLPFDRQNNMPFGIKLSNKVTNRLEKIGDIEGVTELEKKYEDVKYFTALYFNDEFPIIKKQIVITVPEWLTKIGRAHV